MNSSSRPEAIGLVFEVPGASREQYVGVMAHLGGMDHEIPGRLCHFAGPTDEGWLVVDVWRSRERFEEFMAEELLPAARRVGFFTSLPRYFTIDHLVVSGQRNAAAGRPYDRRLRIWKRRAGGRDTVHVTDAQRRSWRTLGQVGAASLVTVAVDGFLDPETRLTPLLIPFFAWGISYVQNHLEDRGMVPALLKAPTGGRF